MRTLRNHNLILFRKLTAICILITFLIATILPVPPAQAQSFLNLPIPGMMVNTSPSFVPVLLKGMTIHPEDPLRFDFILDSGNTKFKEDELKTESERLVKYFLASMTVPKDDLWVNLSPYEKDRIIPDELGKTELGRDMLAQDYILKQLTASLIYPEDELGKKFWKRIYKLAREKYNTTEIPTNTFNKVWILPEKATVYEHANTVFIVNSRFKVMLDQDVEAMDFHQKSTASSRAPARETASTNNPSSISSQIVREIILPEIEKEVNEGENFALLRQIYHSLILSKWYKETIKTSLLNKVYIDQNKIAGVELDDKDLKDKIYERYIEAYKKGVFEYIREDYDQLSRKVIPRKYFSGGEVLTNIPISRTRSARQLTTAIVGDSYSLGIKANPLTQQSTDANRAMLAEWNRKRKVKRLIKEKLGMKSKNSLIKDYHILQAIKIIDEGHDFHVEYQPEVSHIHDEYAGMTDEDREEAEFWKNAGPVHGDSGGAWFNTYGPQQGDRVIDTPEGIRIVKGEKLKENLAMLGDHLKDPFKLKNPAIFDAIHKKFIAIIDKQPIEEDVKNSLKQDFIKFVDGYTVEDSTKSLKALTDLQQSVMYVLLAVVRALPSDAVLMDLMFDILKAYMKASHFLDPQNKPSLMLDWAKVEDTITPQGKYRQFLYRPEPGADPHVILAPIRQYYIDKEKEPRMEPAITLISEDEKDFVDRLLAARTILFFLSKHGNLDPSVFQETIREEGTDLEAHIQSYIVSWAIAENSDIGLVASFDEKRDQSFKNLTLRIRNESLIPTTVTVEQLRVLRDYQNQPVPEYVFMFLIRAANASARNLPAPDEANILAATVLSEIYIKLDAESRKIAEGMLPGGFDDFKTASAGTNTITKNKAMLGYNDADFGAESAWLRLIKTEKNYVKTPDFDDARNKAIEKTGASVVPNVYIVGTEDDKETFGAIYSPDEERIYVQEALIRRISDLDNRADMKTRIFIYMLTEGSHRDKRKAEYEYAKEVNPFLVAHLLPQDRSNGQTFDDVLNNVRKNIVGVDLEKENLRAKLGLGEDVEFVNEDDFVFQTNSKQLLEIGENALYTIAINALNGKIDLDKHFRIDAADDTPPSEDVKAGMLAFAANPFTNAHYLIATLKAMALHETDTFFVSPTKGDFRKPALEATYQKRLAMAREFFERVTGGLIRVMPALPEEEGDGNGINGEEKVLPLLRLNHDAKSVHLYYAAGADHYHSFARDKNGKVKFAKIDTGETGNKKDFDYYVAMHAYPELLSKLLTSEIDSIPEKNLAFVRQLAQERNPQARLAMVQNDASFPVLDVVGKLYLIQQELDREEIFEEMEDKRVVMLNTSRGDQEEDKLRDRMNFPTFFNRGVNIHIAATRLRDGIARLVQRGEFDLKDLGLAPEDLLVELFKTDNREYLYSLIRIKGLKFDEAYEFSNAIDVLLPDDSEREEERHQDLLRKLRTALQSIDEELDVRDERDKENDTSVITITRAGADILRYEYTVKNGISKRAGGNNTFLTKTIDLLVAGALNDLDIARLLIEIESYIKDYNSAQSLIDRFPVLSRNDLEESELEEQDIDVLMLSANDDLRTYAKVLDLYSRGIGKTILISGGEGHQTDEIKAMAQRNGMSVNDGSAAEMIHEIMLHLASQNAQWQHLIDDLQNTTKTVLEKDSKYTVQNFTLTRDLMKGLGLLPAGQRVKVLYIRSPLQQLRAKGAFESAFKDEEVDGISFTVDYLQEPSSIHEIIGEYFRIIANAQKIDAVSQTPDWNVVGSLDSIPRDDWEKVVELSRMPDVNDGWKDVLVANLYRMGHNRESLFDNLPTEPTNVATAIMGNNQAMLSQSGLRALGLATALTLPFALGESLAAQDVKITEVEKQKIESILKRERSNLPINSASFHIARQMGLVSVPYLIKLLNSDRYDERSFAKSALEDMHWAPTTDEEKILTYLIGTSGLRGLDDVSDFGKIAVPYLIKFVQTKMGNRNHKSSAIRELGEIGDASATSFLLGVIQDRDSWAGFKLTAGVALGKIGNKESIPDLEKALESQDEYTTAAAMEALSYFNNKKYIPVFLKYLKQKESAQLVESAARSLGRMGALARPVISDLKAVLDYVENQQVRRQLIYALAETKDEGLVPYFESLFDKKAKRVAIGPLDWMYILEAMGTLGSPKAVPKLLELLKDKEQSQGIRTRSAAAIGKIGDKSVVPEIVKLLDDENDAVQAAAARALGAIGGAEAIKGLNKIIEKGGRLNLLRAVADAYGNIHDTKLLPEMMKMLNSGHPSLVGFVTLALKDFGSDAVPFVIEALNKEGIISVNKSSAILLLRYLGDARAIPDIVRHLTDRDDYVRKYAAEALQGLGWKAKTQEDFIKFLYARQLWRDLIKEGKPAVPILREALKDENKAIQNSAKKALEELGEKVDKEDKDKAMLGEVAVGAAVVGIGGAYYYGRRTIGGIVRFSNIDKDVKSIALKNIDKLREHFIENLVIQTINTTKTEIFYSSASNRYTETETDKFFIGQKTLEEAGLKDHTVDHTDEMGAGTEYRYSYTLKRRINRDWLLTFLGGLTADTAQAEIDALSLKTNQAMLGDYVERVSLLGAVDKLTIAQGEVEDMSWLESIIDFAERFPEATSIGAVVALAAVAGVLSIFISSRADVKEARTIRGNMNKLHRKINELREEHKKHSSPTRYAIGKQLYNADYTLPHEPAYLYESDHDSGFYERIPEDNPDYSPELADRIQRRIEILDDIMYELKYLRERGDSSDELHPDFRKRVDETIRKTLDENAQDIKANQAMLGTTSWYMGRLEHKKASVREAAVRKLRKKGDHAISKPFSSEYLHWPLDIFPLLLQRLLDTDEGVKQAATEVLQEADGIALLIRGRGMADVSLDELENYLTLLGGMSDENIAELYSLIIRHSINSEKIVETVQRLVEPHRGHAIDLLKKRFVDERMREENREAVKQALFELDEEQYIDETAAIETISHSFNKVEIVRAFGTLLPDQRDEGMKILKERSVDHWHAKHGPQLRYALVELGEEEFVAWTSLDKEKNTIRIIHAVEALEPLGKRTKAIAILRVRFINDPSENRDYLSQAFAHLGENDFVTRRTALEQQAQDEILGQVGTSKKRLLKPDLIKQGADLLEDGKPIQATVETRTEQEWVETGEDHPIFGYSYTTEDTIVEYISLNAAMLSHDAARALIEQKLAPEYHDLIRDYHVQEVTSFDPADWDFDVIFHEAVEGDWNIDWPGGAAGSWREGTPARISFSWKYRNQAMLTDEKGGIDLNDINVERTGAGIDIQFNPEVISPLLEMDIQGLTPVIIHFTPLNSILPLLGLKPELKSKEVQLSQLN